MWDEPPMIRKVAVLNGRTYELPDFCNDLNAMHQAETLCAVQLNNKYAKHIREVLDNEAHTSDTAASQHIRFTTWRYYAAPAHIRAEAFLRTLNLWVDDNNEFPV